MPIERDTSLLQAAPLILALTESGLVLCDPPAPGKDADIALTLQQPTMLRLNNGRHITLVVREDLDEDALSAVTHALRNAFPKQHVSVVTAVQHLTVTGTTDE